MKLYVDADGCPVVDESIRVARERDIEVVLLCDCAHQLSREGARTITVLKGADSVDFALVNLICPGDIVVTQDYGLAAMCLAKKALPIHQDGMRYTDENIGGLLAVRHESQKIRRSGGRARGPKKRTASQDNAFSTALIALIVSERTRRV